MSLLPCGGHSFLGIRPISSLVSSNSRTRSNSVAKDSKLTGSKRAVSRSPPRSNKLANTASGPVATSSTSSSNIRKVDYAMMTPGKLADTFNAPTINRSYRYPRLPITCNELELLNTELFQQTEDA